MDVTHIVWDWNGTLVDDLEVVVLSVNAVMREFDGPVVTVEDYRSHYRRPVRRFYDHLLGRSVDEDSWARIDTIFHEHYVAHNHMAPLAAGAIEALETVTGNGGTHSLLSIVAS